MGALTPLMIGFAVLVAHVALIPIDGCSINPARSLGSAVAANAWENHWLFWLGPLLGGPLAAFLYDQFFYTGVADADSSVFKNALKRIRAWQEERRRALENSRNKSAGAKVEEEEEEEEEEAEEEDEEEGGELVVVVPPPGSAVAAQQQQLVGSTLSVQQQVARLQQLGAVSGGVGLGAPPGAGTPSQRVVPPPPLSLPPQEEAASSPEKPRGSVAAVMEAQGSPFLSLVKRGGSPPPNVK